MDTITFECMKCGRKHYALIKSESHRPIMKNPLPTSVGGEKERIASITSAICPVCDPDGFPKHVKINFLVDFEFVDKELNKFLRD